MPSFGRPSTDSAQDNESGQPPLLSPQPRRITPFTTPSTLSVSGSDDASLNMPPADASSMPSKRNSSFLNLTSAHESSNPTNEPGTPQKSRSILNLTSSALYGIYAPTSYNTVSTDHSRRPSSTSLFDQNEPLAISTPWGAGAQTPALRDPNFEPYMTSPGAPKSNGISAEHLAASLKGRDDTLSPSHARKIPHAARRSLLGASVRILLLAGLGVAYGTLITHLHDTRGLAPVRVGIERRSPLYLAFWGSMAVLLGILLPSIDALRSSAPATPSAPSTTRQHHLRARAPPPTSPPMAKSRRLSPDSDRTAPLGAAWNPLVRAVGAFVGIAFAIRRLPWQSPQQLSLTLALVNPCIWYLVDRTRAGFWLAAATGVAGSLLVLSLLPGVVPSPAASSAALAAAAQAAVRGVAGAAEGRVGSGGFWSGAVGGAAAWRPAVWAGAASASASAAAAAAPPTGAVQWAVAHSPGQLPQMMSLDGVGVATWTSSVLFCSSVFFGNVGRRLWS